MRLNLMQWKSSTLQRTVFENFPRVIHNAQKNNLYVSWMSNGIEFSRAAEDENQVQYGTNFLLHEANRATYIQLNQTRWGEWFFTTRLTGCEIWIARDTNGADEPIIIHLNLYDCSNEPGSMKELGDEALQHITNTYPGYNLIKRIVKRRPQFTYPDGTSFYTQSALFYGLYTDESKCGDKYLYSSGWCFYLRDTDRKMFFDLGESIKIL